MIFFRNIFIHRRSISHKEFHTGGVKIMRVELEGGRRQQEQLLEKPRQRAKCAFQVEKSARPPGGEICAEGRKEAFRKLLRIGMHSSIPRS
jgi:hypothetical protein